MLTTPILGIPYAEDEDAMLEYPDGVDLPRANLLEALLAPPFVLLETSTTNTNQNITSATYAPLPNTWSNGATLSFTLTRPALVLATVDARLNGQDMASAAELRAALHVDGVVTATGNNLWLKQWGTANLTTNERQGTALPVALAAGSHNVTLLAMRTGTATYTYINYAVMRVVFIAHTA